jgi:branched-chain amino acid aminotransferase
MAMQSKYIWMNGELVDFEKATVHFLTPALHHGIGVFEGIRCYSTDDGPAVFRLRDHVEHLLSSARVLGFRDLPYSGEEVLAAIKSTVAANGFSECYIRPLIYLSGGGWNLNLDAGKADVGIAVWEWTNYLGEDALERGMHTEQQLESIQHHMTGAIQFKTDKQKTLISVQGVGDAQTRDWIEYKHTNRALMIGAFSLERIR